MSRIASVFAKDKAFIPYITAGDPDMATTLSVLKILAKNGADMIELGIPFTDPVADGPTIQQASERALKHPFRMKSIFGLVREFRNSGYETPVVLMSYANPVFVYGYEDFAKEAVASGIDAVLLTDIPPEEAEDYTAAAKKHGLGTVFLCSPTTSPERLKLVDAASTAYVYYVARAGVTGARDDLPQDVQQALAALKKNLNNPLCVGFGISTPQQAAVMAKYADGVIVGSALVSLFARWRGAELLSHIAKLTQDLKGAIHA
jgi:tryptophan synthase alpha chain